MINDNNTQIFIGFFQRYYKNFEDRMRIVSQNMQIKIKYPSVYQFLYAELMSASFLTLIYELNYYREKDWLVGGDIRRKISVV